MRDFTSSGNWLGIGGIVTDVNDNNEVRQAIEVEVVFNAYDVGGTPGRKRKQSSIEFSSPQT